MYGSQNYKREKFESVSKPLISEATVVDSNKENDKKILRDIKLNVDSIRGGNYLNMIKSTSKYATRGAVVGFVGFAGYAVLKHKSWIIYSICGIVVGGLSGYLIGKKIESRKIKEEIKK